LDLKLFLQFFNTARDEIAPRSDIIGEYLQHSRIRHDWLSIAKERGGSWGMNHPGIEESVKG
jgi:hypothetical protein